jgi:hypothetical protein
MSNVPARTPEQRAEALAKAQQTRRIKAQLRKDLKSGAIAGADVVRGARDHQVWAALRVSWVLEALPGVGPVRAERVMADLGIAASRRIQGLGDRQRTALLARLEGGSR